MKKILILVSLVASLFAMGGGPSLVEVQSVKKMEVNPLEEFIGSIVLSKQGRISSQINGKVQKVFFESAQKVKKGDVLVQIDSQLLNIQIKSAHDKVRLGQLALNNAKRDLNRYNALKNTNSVSQKVLDTANFQYDSAMQNLILAQNNLDELLIQKSYKNIKAPYDGVIVKKNIEVGEWINTGGDIGTIMNVKYADIIVNLPSAYTYKLANEKTFKVTIQKKQYDAKLSGIIPQGNIKTRTFKAKFTLEKVHGNIFDGMEVSIKLPREKKMEALVVPRDAVISKFGQNVVFINNDNKAMMVPVQIINYLGNNIAIRGKGIKVGMEVVSKGNERIFPNMPIKPINKK